MAKKIGFENDFEEGFEILQKRTSTESKLPDNSGGSKQMKEFCLIPIIQLHPFRRKNGMDFSHHGKVLSEQFVESVKQHGILDPLVVRKSSTEQGCYEIIAGESRWTHAKEAGLAEVPCRIVTVSDEKAYELFILSNLMRRELTQSDRIYAWYSYFTELKKGQKLTQKQIEEKLTESASEAEVLTGRNNDSISLRTLYVYVKMHDLTPEWIERLDKKETSVQIAYLLAFFPQNVQKLLLEYTLTYPKVKYLHKHYFGRGKDMEYGPEVLESIFGDNKDQKPEEPSPKKLTKDEKRVERNIRKNSVNLVYHLREIVPQDDYDNVNEIIIQAVKMYYEAQKQGQKEKS